MNTKCEVPGCVNNDFKEKMNLWKYKCPTCYLKYCSLECWKEHRKFKCETPVIESVPNDLKSHSLPVLFPTNDTVQPDVLEKLKESEKLKELMKNPSLREMIKEVDKAKNVRSVMQNAMLEPIFVEFADACLEVVEPVE